MPASVPTQCRSSRTVTRVAVRSSREFPNSTGEGWLPIPSHAELT